MYVYKIVLRMLALALELVFFSSRRRYTSCALVTGVQTCALPISGFSEIATRDLDSTPLDPKGPTHRVTSNISLHGRLSEEGKKIGRASCRERVCQYVYISVVVVSLKKQKNTKETIRIEDIDIKVGKNMRQERRWQVVRI